MPRLMRIATVLSGGLGLLAMSSCMAVSGPNGFAGTSPAGSYSFEHNSTSSVGSLFGGSSAGSGTASSSGSYASSGASSTADGGSGGAVPPGYTNDNSQSNALTGYLQKSRLPLVGAQVMTNASGNREVILYGFVATDFGKQDAVDKARRYLGDPNVGVVNRIAVRPELLASGGSLAPSSSSAASSSASSGSYSTGGLGSVQSYENQAQQAQSQQYMQNQSGLSALLPLIGMMGLLSMGNSSFGTGYGGYPPTYGSPFGSPYSPYPTAPYGSPYGSPYGGSPYGGSPFGYGGGFTFP